MLFLIFTCKITWVKSQQKMCMQRGDNFRNQRLEKPLHWESKRWHMIVGTFCWLLRRENGRPLEFENLVSLPWPKYSLSDSNHHKLSHSGSLSIWETYGFLVDIFGSKSPLWKLHSQLNFSMLLLWHARFQDSHSYICVNGCEASLHRL